MTRLLLLSSALLLPSYPAWARLGESEAQSTARYGPPTTELVAPTDKPLLPGSKEVTFSYSGYRVRIALVQNATVRIEYIHLPEKANLKPLTAAEVNAILEAEKGAGSWREDVPKTGNKGLNDLKTFAEGRKWERSDHAKALLRFQLALQLETRDADALEKKLSKQPGATPALPKF